MKRYYLLFLFWISGLQLFAQSVTFYHDPSIMNQFLLTEGGGGGFVPASYYQFFHKDYMATALGTGKLVFRGLMYQNTYKEVEHSAVIDSMLFERAKIEALNVAERQTKAGDLAWVAEGSAVNKSVTEFSDMINKITIYGGTFEVKEYYKLQLDMIKCGLETVRESYMPMSNREVEYELINKDLKVRISELNKYLFALQCKQRADQMRERKRLQRLNIVSITEGAKGRWKMAMKGRGTGAGS